VKLTVAEAKIALSKLSQAVERDEQVTIRRHAQASVELVISMEDERPIPKFGALKGKINFQPGSLDPMTGAEVDAFMEGSY
jgi:antitoxin (DNA-binding transcriptional repressor) of toxin-antitoxin stability system